MAEISIFIPVYKESEFLEKLLKRLINQGTNKEIFVVVDEPTKKTAEIIKKFKHCVKFVVSSGRMGKANALNHVASLSKSELFLFWMQTSRYHMIKIFCKKFWTGPDMPIS